MNKSLSRDTAAPSSQNADGSYHMPPPFVHVAANGKADDYPLHNTDIDERKRNLRKQLSSFSHSALLDLAVETKCTVHEWERAASDLLSTLALSPEMTDAFYARSLRALLTSALESLDYVDVLQHVECSLPSVATEKPSVNVIQWDGLHFSEFDFQWAPSSWWVSVSANGSRWGLSFNCLANVSGISLSGRVRCSFSNDLTATRIRFVDKPLLNLTVDTSVGWGFVPLPVRESIAQMIRERIEQFVDVRLCNDEGMVIVLKRKPSKRVSESDIYEATMQAQRANSVRLRSSTFF